MLPRASEIVRRLTAEVARRERVIEIDATITKMQFEVIMDRRLKTVKTVRYAQHHEGDEKDT